MKIALLLPTFNRDELLSLGLHSIRQQPTPNVNVLVLDEGKPNAAKEIASRFEAQYFWTAQTKPSPDYWRVPGFALNIGIRLTDADVVILSCPEIYHLQTDTIARLVAPLEGDALALCTCNGRDDTGPFLAALKQDDNPDKRIIEQLWNNSQPLRIELPFLMALRREHLLAIGGYDEDFAGQSFDDDDVVGRLIARGLHYVKTDARCVHLWHFRNYPSRKEAGRLEQNEKLYRERKGQVVRNIGRQWGIP